MTTSFIIVLLAGAVAGGFMNGLAGFGTALLALGFWLQIMPATQAVSIVLVMSVASSVQGLWIVRNEIGANRARLARFLLPGLIGLPLGNSLLDLISASLLKLFIAIFMLLYGAFFILRRSLPRLERQTPLIDTAIGFLGGVLGGAASLSGALPTMWCAMRPWTKGETRAVLQPYNFAILVGAMLIFAFQGKYDRETLIVTLIVLPVTLISADIGIRVFRRLTDTQFRVLLIAFMFFSGLALLLRELF